MFALVTAGLNYLTAQKIKIIRDVSNILFVLHSEQLIDQIMYSYSAQ